MFHSLGSSAVHHDPIKNASILFGILFQKLVNKNEKLFHNNK